MTRRFRRSTGFVRQAFETVDCPWRFLLWTVLHGGKADLRDSLSGGNEQRLRRLQMADANGDGRSELSRIALWE